MLYKNILRFSNNQFMVENHLSHYIIIGYIIVLFSYFDFVHFLILVYFCQKVKRARRVYSLIGNIVISSIKEKSGGVTYINCMNENFLLTFVCEVNYRKSLIAPVIVM